MEQSSLQRKKNLEEKIPELSTTIEMVETLLRKKQEQEEKEFEGGDDRFEFETTFELSDTLYAKGVVEKVDEVYIWLGVSFFLLPTPLRFFSISADSEYLFLGINNVILPSPFRQIPPLRETLDSTTIPPERSRRLGMAEGSDHGLRSWDREGLQLGRGEEEEGEGSESSMKK